MTGVQGCLSLRHWLDVDVSHHRSKVFWSLQRTITETNGEGTCDQIIFPIGAILTAWWLGAETRLSSKELILLKFRCLINHEAFLELWFTLLRPTSLPTAAVTHESPENGVSRPPFGRIAGPDSSYESFTQQRNCLKLIDASRSLLQRRAHRMITDRS